MTAGWAGGRTRAGFPSPAGAMTVAGVPSWLARILVESHVDYWSARATGDPRRWLPKLAAAAMSRGEASERFRAGRQR
jgi:hypothetical protein